MLQDLTSPAQLEAAYQHIALLFGDYAEWLFVSDGVIQPLRREEIEVRFVQHKLVFSCWTEAGTRVWRVLGWDWNGQLLELKVSRRMGAEVLLIELIPRTTAKVVTATIRAARHMLCERLARLAAALETETKVERLSLSRGTKPGQPGRYAQIILLRRRERIAVTGPVVSSPPSAVDAFISSALLWFRRTSERMKPPRVEQLWLIVTPELLKPVVYRIALLRAGLRDIIRVFTVDEHLTALTEVVCPEKEELWKKKLSRFPPVA